MKQGISRSRHEAGLCFGASIAFMYEFDELSCVVKPLIRVCKSSRVRIDTYTSESFVGMYNFAAKFRLEVGGRWPPGE